MRAAAARRAVRGPATAVRRLLVGLSSPVGIGRCALLASACCRPPRAAPLAPSCCAYWRALLAPRRALQCTGEPVQRGSRERPPSAMLERKVVVP
eukprot:5435139-Alexandrium_andersonii.AAC.1